MADSPAIVFIGFMGAGKSTALRHAAEAGLDVTEIDDLMAADLGMPIAEAFEKLGEGAFREREEVVVGELLEAAEGGAIALGGGSVLLPRVAEALRRHVVVWLQVDPEEAWRRIEGSGRPLARSLEDVEELFADRLGLYEGLADAIVMPGDSGVVARALPAIRGLVEMGDGARLIWATGDGGEYPVFCGEGILGGWWPLESRRFGVTDTTVGSLYSDRIQPLEAEIAIDPGEETKTMGTAEEVLRGLAQAGMTRADHVVGLGGGVVGDVAGFCAASYQRGVPVVHVPTTIVAQVDSAYGGKTGVDLPEGKNYAGAYHPPSAVYSDWELVRSLPEPELAAGFVEVLKTALLAGGALWEGVRGIAASQSDDAAEGEGAGLVSHAWVVPACARYKLEVVAADQRDASLRQILNFGHTIGHAIETAAGYGSYRHGEAVGLGLLGALRLSEADELRDETGAWLRQFNLPTALDPSIGVDAVLEALERDKKRTADGVPFVLLSEPGRPEPGCYVEPGRVREAVEELYRDGGDGSP